MSKRLLLSVIATLFLGNIYSQTVIYSEDFTSGATWTLNTVTGVEGATPNPWFISCQEDGQDAGVCGVGANCAVPDNTLHVGSAIGDLGAAYFETGLGGTNTDRRAESGDISTVGQTNLTLSFDMIGWGGNANDYCELFYSDDGGASWTSLAPTLTSMCCGSVACTGLEQGLWQNNTYALPANCENIPNLRIGFVWKNLDDGTATDPSFAVDDIEITTPSTGNPTADFTASNTNICEGDCIDFTDASTLGPNPNWSWTFTGAATGTSNVQNPTGICYPTAGTYQVELTVTDDNGTDTETKIDYITVTACGPGPTSSFTPSATSICVGECLTFTDNSTGTVTGWSWTFNGADTPTANTQDPGQICWSTDGTFDVDLEVTDGTNTNTSTVQITVNPAPPVTATVTPNDTICAGDQITLSGSGAVTYTWDQGVTDATPFVPTATATYTCTGEDANGCTRDFPIEVVVESCDTIQANFGFESNNICLGDCIVFTDSSTGTISSFQWDFGGGATPNTSTDQNPTACFTATGTYNIQLTITDPSGNNSSITQQISVFNAPTVVAVVDTVIDLGGQAELIALGSMPGTYQWLPNNVDCDTCSTTFASPWEDTDYVVTLTDINGCYGEDTLKVLVNFIEGLGVPSAFSPNNDGFNDVLYVKGIGITNIKFSIFNRYGQKVFECDDQSIGWDGTFKGKDENAGVFAWMLEYQLVNGNSGLLKGNTTLIR